MNEGRNPLEQIKRANPKAYSSLVKICEEVRIDPDAALASPSSPHFKAIYAVRNEALEKEIQEKRNVMLRRVNWSIFGTVGFLMGRSVARRLGNSHRLLLRSRIVPVLMFGGCAGVSVGLFRYDMERSELMEYYQKSKKFEIDYQLFEWKLNEQVKLNYRQNQRKGVEMSEKMKELMDDDQQLDI